MAREIEKKKRTQNNKNVKCCNSKSLCLPVNVNAALLVVLFFSLCFAMLCRRFSVSVSLFSSFSLLSIEMFTQRTLRTIQCCAVGSTGIA